MNNFLNGVGIGGQTNYGTVYLDNNGQVQTVAPGTSGYVLTSNGSSSAPTFQLAGTSGLSGLTTDGVLYASASNAAASTAAGTSGQVLTSNGAGSAPSFQASSGGGGGANASYQAQPSNPGAITTAGAWFMMGLAGSITPSNSGKILVIIAADGHASANGNFSYQIAYGTGTAPSFFASLTGTSAGSAVNLNVSGNNNINSRFPLSLNAVITGLSVGTAYWFDIALLNNASSALIENISFSIIEF